MNTLQGETSIWSCSGPSWDGDHPASRGSISALSRSRYCKVLCTKLKFTFRHVLSLDPRSGVIQNQTWFFFIMTTLWREFSFHPLPFLGYSFRSFDCSKYVIISRCFTILATDFWTYSCLLIPLKVLYPKLNNTPGVIWLLWGRERQSSAFLCSL